MFMGSHRKLDPSSPPQREHTHTRTSMTLALLLLLGAMIQPVSAQSKVNQLEVESKPKWGFDGTIQVEDFNLLTVEIFNNSETPWQGAVWLQPQTGLQTVDLPIIQPDLFIEPYGTRQLQFYVFLPDRTEYNLTWGAIRNGRLIPQNDYKIDSPKINHSRLTIQLTNPNRGGRSGDLPAFNEENFPSSAAVLSPVEGIVLDHVPRWQQPQIQAFRDWLYGGGTLYLLSSDTETLRDFPNSLAELNEPSDQFPVGFGKVVRTSEPVKVEQPTKQPQNSYKNFSSSGTLFSMLKAMTTPEHNWGLIYSMAVVYLLILFPGCWLIGRKKGDFRLTYTVVLATVALFSFGFHSIGKRGYGEETTINSVAILKPGQPGRWVVKQWSNFFITGGGDYNIEHDVDGSAISTGQHTESVRGMASNQPGAMMRTDIPSFSNRTVLHSGILKSLKFRPEVSQLVSTKAKLKTLELSLPAGQQWPEFGHKVAIYRDQIYQLMLSDGKLKMVGQGQRARQLDYDAITYNPYRWGNQEDEPPEQLYDKSFWLAIADDLGLFNGENIDLETLPKDVVKIYLMTDMDSNLFAKGERFPQQSGRMIYSFDLHTNTTD